MALMGHLRYAGPPYRGKPGKLAKHLGLSSGAMTNRLDNMAERGLLRRLDDPDDRRGVIVELTEEGQRVWEESVGTQAQKEELVASALDENEKRALNDLLRRLMNAFEEFHGPVARATDWGSGLPGRRPVPADRRGVLVPRLSSRAVKVTLPDGAELELPEGASALDAARAIGPKLAEQAVLARVDGEVHDLRLPLRRRRARSSS